MHVQSEPSILYFGTPVVLISTLNEDGTYNLAPMSSAFWLGWRCILDLSAKSKTTQKLIRTGECVLNLPSMTSETVDAPRVHIEESIWLAGEPNRIDPDKWRPLIMSFQEFYGLGSRLQSSTLGQIPEYLYRSPDGDRARNVKE